MSRGSAVVENAPWPHQPGRRCLAVRYRQLARGRAARVATPTSIPLDTSDLRTYQLMGSPTLYAGQRLRTLIAADGANDRPVICRLYIRTYDQHDTAVVTYGPEARLMPRDEVVLRWQIGDTAGAPIAEVGVEIGSETRADGSVYLDYLTWEGAPEVVFTPTTSGTMWQRAWIQGVDQFDARSADEYRVIQNDGTGLVMQGTREWEDYTVSARVTPHLVRACGIGIRVQGMRRYYALLLAEGGIVRLIKELDGKRVLAEARIAWESEHGYALEVTAVGARLQGRVAGQAVFDVEDTDHPLMGGAVGIICQAGYTSVGPITVKSVPIGDGGPA